MIVIRISPFYEFLISYFDFNKEILNVFVCTYFISLVLF